MLAHLSRKRLVRGDARTGVLEYEDTALRWSGANAAGDEFGSPSCYVIDVGQCFVIGTYRKLYPIRWGYGVTPQRCVYLAINEQGGFTLLYKQGDEEEPC